MSYSCATLPETERFPQTERTWLVVLKLDSPGKIWMVGYPECIAQQTGSVYKINKHLYGLHLP